MQDEHAPENAAEEQAIAGMICRLKEKITQESSPGKFRRDTHSKMYGLVKAEFIISPKLPEELAFGLFQTPQTFQAWIRFSNQDTGNKPDLERDIRGMAIKLMGVPGIKLCAPIDGNTHDFVLINPPMFIAKDVFEFAGMLAALQGNLWQKIVFFTLHFKVLCNLLMSAVQIANPLHTRYYSTTPYRLGERVVKYSAIPRYRTADIVPLEAPDNYLRDAMTRSLSRNEAYFDFCVQLQTNENEMPLENAQVEWSEELSSFHKVATIRILQQDFDDTAHDQLGENLSFNPWRALEVHQPLGSINRARRKVYEAISAFRHKGNEQIESEPSSWDLP